MKKILITGAAGFIGFHTVLRFLQEGYFVVGLDNINDYYSTTLKYDRLSECGISKEDIKWNLLVKSSRFSNYQFIRANLEDKYQIFNLFNSEKFEYVINLAAQAGVRYSIENPDLYIQSNIVGFHHILEACRHYPVKQLIQASSSSVYGDNGNVPFSEEDKVDNPVSLYAATKKSNELSAHAYSSLYQIPVTCLRFFTVYGPWGRPDMAPMLFANAILKNKPIKVFNNGEMKRDFTYIDDIVEGIFRVSHAGFGNSILPYRILNIGKGAPISLLEFIEIMEENFGKKASKIFLPMQLGDVTITYADTSKIEGILYYRPKITLVEGLKKFTDWFKDKKDKSY